MTYIVYQLTSPSGKKYFGLSSKTLSVRVSTHMKDRQRLINRGKHLPRLYAAFGKYPIDLWKQTVLFEGLTRSEAEVKERELIAIHNTQNPSCGYNMAEGGIGGDTGRNGELDKRQKHSERMKALNADPLFVKNRIEKGQTSIRNNPEQFRVNAIKRKMRLRRSSNHQNHTGMWVVRGVPYGSLREAVASTGVSESTIVKFCNKPDVVAGCTNKYIKIGTTPRENGYYKTIKEKDNGKV